jgi:hypothetical protein
MDVVCPIRFVSIIYAKLNNVLRMVNPELLEMHKYLIAFLGPKGIKQRKPNDESG